MIPMVIAEDTQADVIPESVRRTLPNVRYFLAENVRTARRYLSSLKVYPSIEPLVFEVLDKNTDAAEVGRMLKPVMEGADVGILSESGCPGIADPGALAVEYAHKHDITVVPLVGPSSILLALMGSGLNGQKFTFHGYLPIDSKDLTQVIKELEGESRKRSQTQIFIETPYRNNAMMTALLKSLNDSTLLTIAMDMTGKNEMIKSRTVKQWKDLKISLPKEPIVFLFLAR